MPPLERAGLLFQQFCELYFSLQRPRYTELKAVMEQIPDIHRDSLEQFDSKLLNPTPQKVADKRRKDHFKRLIAGCIEVGDILEENEPVLFHTSILQKSARFLLDFCEDGGTGVWYTKLKAGELVQGWLPPMPWHLKRTRPEISQNASKWCGPQDCSESGVCL